jgi:hypothetical protein
VFEGRLIGDGLLEEDGVCVGICIQEYHSYKH